jgi:uncharacterized protein YkwD
MPRASSSSSRTRVGSLAAVTALLACGATGGLGAGSARAVTVPIDPGSLLPGGQSSAGQSCPDARRRPARVGHRRARAALLCAINRARVAHGLPAWAINPSLRRAAGRHAADMVRRHYFAHVRAGGLDVLSRLRAAGWSGTAYGEALAWGCGTRARPRATVRSWLASPMHRAILLSPLYREAGVGVADRAPGGCRGGTWVLDAGLG